MEEKLYNSDDYIVQISVNIGNFNGGEEIRNNNVIDNFEVKENLTLVQDDDELDNSNGMEIYRTRHNDS